MGFDEAVWGRSNRQAQEYWKEAESALREAMDLQPAATEIAHLLIHLLICAGRIQQVPPPGFLSLHLPRLTADRYASGMVVERNAIAGHGRRSRSA